MNVLSLFDGMSCGRIALERAGIPVTNYYASEINKAAIICSKQNYPEILHVGDVTKVRIPKGQKIDLLIGGSPCQGFSFNGKRLNFNDPRSKLFFEYVRLLKEIRRYNPDVKFLLENVKMSKESESVITETLVVTPNKINSSLFSAQNRPRIYWTNIDVSDLPNSEQVFDDIKSNEHVTEKMYLSNNYKDDLKLKPGVSRISELVRNLRDTNPSKTNCVLKTQIENDTPSLISRQSDRVYCSMSKSPCLTASGSERIKFNMNSNDPKNWRVINTREAERLQTVPDGYTDCIPTAKAFECLGNGWTVDVIAHIFKGLL